MNKKVKKIDKCLKMQNVPKKKQEIEAINWLTVEQDNWISW